MTRNLIQLCRGLGEREFDPRETLQLLQRYQFRFWSWNANRFTNLENKGLLFKVQGNHHKGYVLITLGYDDTYKVHIVSTQGNVKDTYEGIYFDMLFETIDDRIERIEEYVR
jgi:hypothetical protein